MSLIEQAAKRLEELRRAGVEVPEIPVKHADAVATPAAPIGSGLSVTSHAP